LFGTIDPYQTQARIGQKHRWSGTFRGSVEKMRGEMRSTWEPLARAFEIGADVTAIDTGDARRDGHLRSGNRSKRRSTPRSCSRSSAISPRERTRRRERRFLTIRDVTSPHSMSAEGIGRRRKGGQTWARASITIDRRNSGPVWNNRSRTACSRRQVRVTIGGGARARPREGGASRHSFPGRPQWR